MSKHPRAQVVPFSSIVGSSVTLHDPETGRVFGQLAILNTDGDTHDDWKQRQMAVAEDAAKRINLHDELVAKLKKLSGAISDGLCNAGTPGFDNTRLDRAITEANIVLAQAEDAST